MLYHCRIAVGHYARLLGEQCSRTPYPPLAVLSLLWLHAADPYAESVIVHVTQHDLAGFIASSVRLRQILAKLVEVGAVKKLDFGYALHKPPAAELDDIARAQVLASPAVLGGTDAAAQARRTPVEREVAALSRKQRQQDKRRAAACRREALEKLGKQPSDVRDVLARMAGIAPNTLRFSGQGSAAVTAAIDWLASTGATWPAFFDLCVRVHKDRSEDRPPELQWLFAAKHDAYVRRMLGGEVSAKPDADGGAE